MSPLSELIGVASEPASKIGGGRSAGLSEVLIERHSPEYRSKGSGASRASCYADRPGAGATLRAMRSTPELDAKLRARLIEAVDALTNGNADAFGRRLGYTNGGYIREIIRNVKPVRESLIDRVHALPGYEGWFAHLLPSVVAADLAQRTAASAFDEPFSRAAMVLARDFDAVPAGPPKEVLYQVLRDQIRRAQAGLPALIPDLKPISAQGQSGRTEPVRSRGTP